MPTRWQLFKEFVRALWQLSLSLLTALLLFLGAIWYLFARETSLLYFVIAAAVLWLAANIALFVYTMREYRRQVPIMEIMVEKGVCDEVLQKHCALYPHPAQSELLRRVDLLLAMERWDEAEALLNTIPEAEVKPPNIVLYYNCLLLLLTETGRVSLAYKIFCDNRGMIDSYAGKTKQSARGAYYATATTLLALCGDAAGSAQYLSLTEIVYGESKGLPQFLPRIIRAERLYALGERAEAENLAAVLRAEIAESDVLKKDWERRQLLHMLDRAAQRSTSSEGK